MFQQFTIARSGLSMYQRMMYVITNNIANAQTPGHKQDNLEVSELFPNVYSAAVASYDPEDPFSKPKKGMQIGGGVQIAGVTKDFSQGNIQVTNNELDFAIQGKGFFQYRLPDGKIGYGRSGAFQVDADGNVMHQNGYPLEPAIRIPQNATSLTVDGEGRVFVGVNQDTVPREVGQVLLARFTNPHGLNSLGHGLYEATEESGDALIEVPGRNAAGELVQFAREGSNVDVIREMMEMITTQKGMDLMTKAMTTGEAMMKAGLGLK